MLWQTFRLGASRLSLNIFRASSTWVHIDHFSYKLEGIDPLLEIPTVHVDTIFRLKTVVSQRIPSAFGDVYKGQISIFDGETLLDNSENTPAKSKEEPLVAKFALTEEQIVVMEQQKIKLEKKNKAFRTGKAFSKALLASELERVPLPSDWDETWDDEPAPIYVLKNIPQLSQFNVDPIDIYVRESVVSFWNVVDDTLQSKPLQRPVGAVGAVGAPGVGKSTTFPVLIRKLLKEGKTVTYLSRSVGKQGFYYHFVPNQVGEIEQVKVFPESTSTNLIPSMNDPEAYLLVDPGRTKDTCDRSYNIAVKLVINASPNSDHWGGNQFAKRHDQGGRASGSFLYFPPYTLSELLVVVPLCKPSTSKKDIVENFHYYGGSIRLQLSTQQAQKHFRKAQNIAIQNLSVEVAGNIIRGAYAVDFSPKMENMPPSSVLSLEPEDCNNFRGQYPILLSANVLDKMGSKVEDALWYAVKANRPDSWAMLKKIARMQLQRRNTCEFTIRPCVGRNDDQYHQTEQVELGQCPGEKCVWNMISEIASEIPAENGKTQVLFSTNQRHPLFDFIYRDGDCFHAFNANMSDGRKEIKMARLKHVVHEIVENLKMVDHGERRFYLYFATSSETFDSFVTSPVSFPLPEVEGINNLSERFKIFHCNIEKK